MGKNDLEGKRSEGQKQVGKVLVNMRDKLGLVKSNRHKRRGKEDSETGAVKKSDMWDVLLLEGPAISQLKLLLF